jgi:hypothetical protein
MATVIQPPKPQKGRAQALAARPGSGQSSPKAAAKLKAQGSALFRIGFYPLGRLETPANSAFFGVEQSAIIVEQLAGSPLKA